MCAEGRHCSGSGERMIRVDVACGLMHRSTLNSLYSPDVNRDEVMENERDERRWQSRMKGMGMGKWRGGR